MALWMLRLYTEEDTVLGRKGCVGRPRMECIWMRLAGLRRGTPRAPSVPRLMAVDTNLERDVPTSVSIRALEAVREKTEFSAMRLNNTFAEV